MFWGVLFIIFVLLIAAAAPEGIAVAWVASPWQAFFFATLATAVFYAGIYGGSRLLLEKIKRHKNFSSLFVNCALICYLCFIFFLLSPQRLWRELPFFSFLTALAVITLFFGGLALYYAGSYYRRFLYPEAEVQSRWQFALQQLQMWLPFSLPFLFFVFTADLLELTPFGRWLESETNPESAFGLFIYIAFTALTLLLLAAFLPWLLQKLWLCKPLEDVDLWLRLVKVANKANFRFAGIRIWTVMNQFHTAGIIGIFPRFRYVMFTKRLLYEIPPESIEAILIHEIGHSNRRHLLILPCILLGMFAAAGLFSHYFSEPIHQYIEAQNEMAPSPLWEALDLLSVIVPYLLIFALYFRFVFGFFSRLFERQADLHPFVVGTDPEQMIQALDNIAVATGNTHNVPCWHHYSIAERISFLKRAIADPQEVERHNKRVRWWVSVYFLCLLPLLLLFLS